MFTVYLILISALILTIWFIGYRLSRTDWETAWVTWLAGWNRFYCRWYHGFKGEEISLPDGKVLVISNHVSSLDPLIILAACERPLRFMVAKEQYQSPIFYWLLKNVGCIPVDRSGRVEVAFNATLEKLNQGEAVGLFPHGKMHKDSDPYQPLKRGVFKLAEITQCPIIPVRITGVRFPGSMLLCLIFPSRVKLQVFKTIPAGTKLSSEQRKHLAKMLLGRVGDVEHYG